MSAKKARSLVLGRLWGHSQEERQPLARTPDERTTACFNEHARDIARVLQNMFTGREDVDDAVQDAFLRLHEALARDEEIDNLRGWVFTVAKNQLICAVRRTNLQEKTYKPTSH
jgi:RNA polymerase sigma factor (sigma-70 family)